MATIPRLLTRRAQGIAGAISQTTSAVAGIANIFIEDEINNQLRNAQVQATRMFGEFDRGLLESEEYLTYGEQYDDFSKKTYEDITGAMTMPRAKAAFDTWWVGRDEQYKNQIAEQTRAVQISTSVAEIQGRMQNAVNTGDVEAVEREFSTESAARLLGPVKAQKLYVAAKHDAMVTMYRKQFEAMDPRAAVAILKDTQTHPTPDGLTDDDRENLLRYFAGNVDVQEERAKDERKALWEENESVYLQKAAKVGDYAKGFANREDIGQYITGTSPTFAKSVVLPKLKEWDAANEPESRLEHRQNVTQAEMIASIMQYGANADPDAEAPWDGDTLANLVNTNVVRSNQTSALRTEYDQAVAKRESRAGKLASAEETAAKEAEKEVERTAEEQRKHDQSVKAAEVRVGLQKAAREGKAPDTVITEEELLAMRKAKKIDEEDFESLLSMYKAGVEGVIDWEMGVEAAGFRKTMVDARTAGDAPTVSTAELAQAYAVDRTITEKDFTALVTLQARHAAEFAEEEDARADEVQLEKWDANESAAYSTLFQALMDGKNPALVMSVGDVDAMLKRDDVDTERHDAILQKRQTLQKLHESQPDTTEEGWDHNAALMVLDRTKNQQTKKDWLIENAIHFSGNDLFKWYTRIDETAGDSERKAVFDIVDDYIQAALRVPDIDDADRKKLAILAGNILDQVESHMEKTPGEAEEWRRYTTRLLAEDSVRKLETLLEGSMDAQWRNIVGRREFRTLDVLETAREQGMLPEYPQAAAQYALGVEKIEQREQEFVETVLPRRVTVEDVREQDFGDGRERFFTTSDGGVYYVATEKAGDRMRRILYKLSDDRESWDKVKEE